MADDEDFRIKDAKRFAELDERFSATLFSFYTIDEKMVAPIAALSPVFVQEEKSWHPFGIMVASGKFGKLKRHHVKLVTGPPELRIFSDLREIELPDANYLIMFSPCIATKEHTDHFVARRTIDIVLGLLRAVCGSSITLAHFGDQVIIPAIMEQSDYSELFRIPNRNDTVHFTDPNILRQVFFTLATVNPNQKGAILQTLYMFGRASQETNITFRFTLSWIALEMIGQTKGDGVAAKLANAYGVKKQFIYDDLEFRRAYEYRHALFHRGITHDYDSRLERLMQCYFLDLLRARLHLPCMRLAEAAKIAMGPLGA
jgi:hypothetical protein